MKFYKPKNLGFTLIELLFVVAIISLLSSIILSNVKDAREKAKISKYRQDVYQFINALELYKSDNGIYPGQAVAATSEIYSAVGFYSDTSYNLTTTQLNNMLTKYNSSLPKPVIAGGAATTNRIYYYVNKSGLSSRHKCENDQTVPDYVIVVGGDANFQVPGFSDWPKHQASHNNNPNFTTLNYQKCFSL